MNYGYQKNYWIFALENILKNFNWRLKMKLLKIASSFAAFFYTGAALAQSKPEYPMSVPEPSVIGLISLGVIAVFVASRFKK